MRVELNNLVCCQSKHSSQFIYRKLNDLKNNFFKNNQLYLLKLLIDGNAFTVDLCFNILKDDEQNFPFLHFGK